MAWFEFHNAGNSEAQQLQATSFLFAQTAAGKAATGVLSGFAVSQTTTAGPSVVVSAGAGVVQAATLNGASLVGDVQDTTLDVLTGSPMGAVPRNDLVVADQATGSIRVIVGSPNVTPTDPSVPSSAIKLARIRNAANATSVPSSAIDDLRVFTQLAGAAGSPGVPFAVASGYYQHTGTILSTASVGPFPISFPAGRFTVKPNVQLSINEGSRLVAYATSVSTTGFNLYLRNVSASDSPANSDNVTWQATQMTATSANG